MRALSALRRLELSRSRPHLPWGAALGGLFLVALALRLGTIVELADIATFRSLVVDAARYDELARQIAGGRILPDRPFDQAPLYPYFLALVYAVSGAAPAAVRVVQAVLSAATVVLIAAVTGRTFGRPAGGAAGILAAFYGPMVFYAGLLWKPTLVLFLLALVLFLLAGRDGRVEPGMGRITAAGLALGAGGLLRENVLLLAPFLALLLWTRAGTTWRRPAVVPVLVLAAATALPLLPVVWANHRASGEWMVTSSQGGMNFYIGNSRQATGTYFPFSENSQDPEQLALDSRAVAARLLSERTGREVRVEELSRPESSRVLWAETGRQIAEDPGRWLALLGRKSRLFWNAYEIPDAEGWVVYRQLSAVLSLSVVGFGLVAPLAVVGLVPAFRRASRVAWLTVAGAAGLWASVLPFFVLGRYRLPVVVFLLPLAGLGVTWLAELVTRRRWRPLAAAVAGGAVAAALVWPPPFFPAERRQHKVALWFNLGTAANRLAGEAREPSNGFARATQAVGYLDRALATDPGFPAARVERAVARHRQGVFLEIAGRRAEALAAYDEAVRELERVLALPPESLPAGLAEQAAGVLETARRNRGRWVG